MPDFIPPSAYDRSKAHEHDAMTFLGVAQEAAAIMSKAAGEGGDPFGEAKGLFVSAKTQAQVHAELATAAATRALADVLEDIRRMMP